MKQFDDGTRTWYLHCDECPMVFLGDDEEEDLEPCAKEAGWKQTGTNRHLCDDCARKLGVN